MEKIDLKFIGDSEVWDYLNDNPVKITENSYLSFSRNVRYKEEVNVFEYLALCTNPEAERYQKEDFILSLGEIITIEREQYIIE